MFMHHHNLGPSDAAIFINGVFFDMDTTDIFSLLQTLKQETRILEALHKIKIPVSNELFYDKFTIFSLYLLYWFCTLCFYIHYSN